MANQTKVQLPLPNKIAVPTANPQIIPTVTPIIQDGEQESLRLERSETYKTFMFIDIYNNTRKTFIAHTYTPKGLFSRCYV